jgi:hypothetical protein
MLAKSVDPQSMVAPQRKGRMQMLNLAQIIVCITLALFLFISTDSDLLSPNSFCTAISDILTITYIFTRTQHNTCKSTSPAWSVFSRFVISFFLLTIPTPAISLHQRGTSVPPADGMLFLLTFIYHFTCPYPQPQPQLEFKHLNLLMPHSVSVSLGQQATDYLQQCAMTTVVDCYR